MMKRYSNWLVSVMVAAAGTMLATQTAWAQQPSNIVLIYSDDVGYGNISTTSSNGTLITPNITDELIAKGASFSQAYVTCPICSPSRAALMTGRYQQRFGYEWNYRYSDPSPKIGLPTHQKNLAERLQDLYEANDPNHYYTQWVGKWHLGTGGQFWPDARGFDEWYESRGVTEKSPIRCQYWACPSDEETATKCAYESATYDDWICTDSEGDKICYYQVYDNANQAAEFIRANSHRPFFLYLAFNATHGVGDNEPGPEYWEATEEDLVALFGQQSYPDGYNDEQKMKASLYAMDKAIGQVLDAISDPNDDQDESDSMHDWTYIIYANDNGGLVPPTTNEPLRGQKNQFWEGGIRTPLVIRGPGIAENMPGGEVHDFVVTTMDIVPTCIAAALGNNPPNAVISANITTGLAPLAVHFDASASNDPDSESIVSYTWDFGDGSSEETTTDSENDHTYETNDTYQAKITVTDARGATGTSHVIINVSGDGIAKVAENYESLPTWVSEYESTPSTWLVDLPGRSGKALTVTQNDDGSSTKISKYPVSSYTDYIVSIYMACPACPEGSTYSAEVAYRLGTCGGLDYCGVQDFHNNPNDWTTIQKFTSEEDDWPNGNNDAMIQYRSHFNSGSDEIINIAYKVSSIGPDTPVVKFDTLRIIPGDGTFPLDGVNLLPYIRTEDRLLQPENGLHQVLAWRMFKRWAIRKDDYKLIKPEDDTPFSGIEMYDLSNDEWTNVIENEQEASQEVRSAKADLLKEFQAWEVQMHKPLWEMDPFDTDDEYRFRQEEVQGEACWSAEDKWNNGEQALNPKTLRASESYANMIITFSTKDSESYKAINDMSRQTGRDFMLTELRLTDEFGGTAPYSCTIESQTAGQNPLMFVNNLSKEHPKILLDATSTSDHLFTFQVSTPINLYNDLKITGDGTQEFIFTGDINDAEEDRSCSLTKSGTSEVRLEGNVNIGGDLYIHGGTLEIASEQPRTWKGNVYIGCLEKPATLRTNNIGDVTNLFELKVQGNFVICAYGQWQIQSAGTFVASLGKDFVVMTNQSSGMPPQKCAVRFDGGLGEGSGTLEIAGRNGSGFDDNFAFDSVTVSNGFDLQLVDHYDNGNRDIFEKETVFSKSLDIEDGAHLDVNTSFLYVDSDVEAQLDGWIGDQRLSDNTGLQLDASFDPTKDWTVVTPLPDQLHIDGPIPNHVAMGISGTVYAHVEANFIGLPGRKVVFSKVTGDQLTGTYDFTSGAVSPDGTQSTAWTDEYGKTQMTFACNGVGPALIHVMVDNTPLLAYSFFEIVTCSEMEDIKADFDDDCDVDIDDFHMFLACISGSAIPMTLGCENEDLDNDNDVDQSDFGFFQNCYSGPDQPADPNCEN